MLLRGGKACCVIPRIELGDGREMGRRLGLAFVPSAIKLKGGVTPSIAVRFDTSVYSRSGLLSSLLNIGYSGRDVDKNG
jgi:hypothetical protein